VPPARAHEIAACVAILTDGRPESEQAAVRPGLTALLDEARRAWPQIDLGAVDFVRHVATVLPEGGALASAVDSIAAQAGDLYLACACARGDARAIAELERKYLAQLDPHIARVDRDAAFMDEARQLLRRRLLVVDEPGAPPRIAQYKGTGPLGAWLRVAAVRTARNLQRARRGLGRERRLEAGGSELPMPIADPELEYLRARYAPQLRDALKATLAGLPPRERNILRLHYLEGMASGAIARIYGVTGATIRRWIAEARGVIVTEATRRLRETLGADSGELDSLIALIQSGVDLTLSDALIHPPPR